MNDFVNSKWSESSALGCQYLTWQQSTDGSDYGVILAAFNTCKAAYSSILLQYTIEMSQEDWDLAVVYNQNAAAAEISNCQITATGSKTCNLVIGRSGLQYGGLVVPQPLREINVTAMGYTWE